MRHARHAADSGPGAAGHWTDAASAEHGDLLDVIRESCGFIDFREEMGILIMEVVGSQVGKYFFPCYAGVAFSTNEFRWSPRINRQDGVVRLVLGLGTRAVDRTINDYPLLFSPGQTNLKVNNSYQDKVRYSQRYVDVINLETKNFETIEFDELIKQYKIDLYTKAYIEEIVKRTVDTVVTDLELKSYYNQNKENFRTNGTLVRLRYINLKKDNPKYETIKSKFFDFRK